MESDREGGQYGIRYKSSILNRLHDEDEHIPIIKKFYHSNMDLEVKKEDVLYLILKKFPIISEDIHIDKIIELKNDSDLKSRYYELRDFITTISKSNLSLNEINDKIEFLLDQYRERLELHKLKYHTSVFETFCISTTQFLEDMLKFKLSTAIKSIFEINKKKIEVIEAEKNIPGRELSYIYKVSERLS